MPAVVISILVTCLLVIGTKESATANSVLVVVKLTVCCAQTGLPCDVGMEIAGSFIVVTLPPPGPYATCQ